MGDMLGLVEKAQAEFDTEQAARMQERMAKGRFTLDDFLVQVRQMQKLGPMKQIMKLMPGMGSQMDGMQFDGDEFKQIEAMILSMTPGEREDPTVLDGSRRRRIARGSGADPQDVSGLIKQFAMMASMMKQMVGMGTKDRMRFAQQVGEISMSGGTPRFKVKQRSKRLTKKERQKRKKKRRK